MRRYQLGAHTKTDLKVHVVWIAKYRKRVLTGQVAIRTRDILRQIAMEHEIDIIPGKVSSDHVHIFLSYSPSHSPSETIKEIKRASTNFINEKGWSGRKFQWQNGYGCFSYSRSQIDDVVKYILNQQNHHAKRSFREEYLEFLKRFEVEFNEQFLFEFFDD